MSDQVLTHKHIDQLRKQLELNEGELLGNWQVAPEFVVKPPVRRSPEFLRFGINTTEARIVERPNVETAFPMYHYTIQLRFKPSQLYQMSKKIMEAVEGGLGDLEMDTIELNIDMAGQQSTLRTMADPPPVSGLCTPHRMRFTGGGLDE